MPNERHHAMESPQPFVLVVDDEQEILDQVRAVLERVGYDNQCCRSAEEAIDYTADHDVDLIISDINLDGQSGLEMARRIGESVNGSPPPVMFLSGVQMPDIIRRSHDAGGTYYLRKPFDPEVLIELIDKALWMPHLVNDHLQRSAT